MTALDVSIAFKGVASKGPTARPSWMSRASRKVAIPILSFGIFGI
jgi:hypothetical protein